RSRRLSSTPCTAGSRRTRPGSRRSGPPRRRPSRWRRRGARSPPPGRRAGERRRRVICVRRVRFSAAHTYHQPHRVPPAETRALFGAAANAHPHGHDYALEVAIEGPVSDRHGMVVNLAELKAVLGETVLRDLDHRFLNSEVPYFRDRAPTLEN